MKSNGLLSWGAEAKLPPRPWGLLTASLVSTALLSALVMGVGLCRHHDPRPLLPMSAPDAGRNDGYWPPMASVLDGAQAQQGATKRQNSPDAEKSLLQETAWALPWLIQHCLAASAAHLEDTAQQGASERLRPMDLRINFSNGIAAQETVLNDDLPARIGGPALETLSIRF